MIRSRVHIVSVVGALAAAMVLLVAGWSSIPANAQQSPSGPEVTINNVAFGPGTLTVAVGTTVTWINQDDVPHTVVSADKVFKSTALDTKEKFAYTFAKVGTYAYFCSIHPKMTGTIVVQ